MARPAAGGARPSRIGARAHPPANGREGSDSVATPAVHPQKIQKMAHQSRIASSGRIGLKSTLDYPTKPARIIVDFTAGVRTTSSHA